eukprot:6403833-Pyramimonas_sp.AAC.1
MFAPAPNVRDNSPPASPSQDMNPPKLTASLKDVMRSPVGLVISPIGDILMCCCICAALSQLN